jgi:hypothetical protein
MEKKELEFVVEQQKKLKELSNKDLVELMDKLSLEFESIKQSVINQTYYLDSIKLMYDNTLLEYKNRQ